MPLPLVSDDLGEAIEPLLPRERPKPRGGRPRVPDRSALGGIVFVLRTGTPWRLLTQELGRGSGSTCCSLAGLLGYRRLGVRYERRSDLVLGLLHLACALTCLRCLPA
jgi:transposase